MVISIDIGLNGRKVCRQGVYTSGVSIRHDTITGISTNFSYTMKGPLSADRLFFLSALASVVSFVIYNILMYVWPMPIDPNYMPAMTDPDQLLNSLSWVLAWAGVLTFALGMLARR